MLRLPLAVLTALLLLVPAAPAGAAAKDLGRSKLLWATINTCDTRRHPDTLGVRASMPGTGRRSERMVMRIKPQWFSTRDGRWHNFLAPAVREKVLRVGSARFRARRSGWDFVFDLDRGQRFRMRAKVRFEWWRGPRLVRKHTRLTVAGHGSSLGDPPGYSRATCMLRG